MRILFLAYWSLDDALTTATVLPHLQLLHERPDVAAIRLVTIERGESAKRPPVLTLPFTSDKVSFQPLLSLPGRSVLQTKIDDFRRFPRELQVQAAEFGADFIIARGAPAGSLAYLVWQKTRLPFYVESFEPHAQYMREAGVWRWYDPRYLFERYWENQQKKHACGLLPVAENYRRQLLREGVAPERVVTVPCSVNLTDFAYHPAWRAEVRTNLGWSEAAVVGVYAGKFGGIYYDAEAFALFRQVADFFGPGFRLLLLSPQPAAELMARLAAVGLEAEQVSVQFVPFREVPRYLSAADFAFNLHRPSAYVSPIKVGEYWASGLPVLLPTGVGDDSDILAAAPAAGAVFDLGTPDSVTGALAHLQRLLQAPDPRLAPRQLAERYRSLAPARRAYTTLLPSP